MNDLELQREVRAALRRREADVNDPAAVPPARLVLRQTRRRQLATVLITAAVAIALVLVAVTGITSLLRSAERRTPLEPPDRFSPDRLEAVPIGSYSFTDPTADSDGIWWWVGPGVTRFDPASGEIRTFTEADDPAFGSVYAIAPARAGGVWLALSSADRTVRVQGDRIRQIVEGAWCDIAEGPDGTLYGAGCGNDGVFKWDGDSWEPLPAEGRPEAGAVPLIIDGSGAVWVSNDRFPGPKPEGISRFDGSTWTTWTTGDGLPSDGVYAIDIAPGGDVWVATRSGVARFTDGGWVAYPRTQTGISHVISIVATADDVWIGGWNSQSDPGPIYAARFDGSTWVPVPTADFPGTDRQSGISFVHGPGGVWATTDAGLFRFDEAGWGLVVPTGEGPSADGLGWPITSIAAADGDTLWMAAWTTRRGIWRLDGGSWTHFDQTDGLPSNRVYEVAVSPDGAVLAATQGGVARFNGSGWERIASGEAHAIAFGPGGAAWAAEGSPQGTTSVGPVGGERLVPPAPLHPNGFRFLVAASDDMWAGSTGSWGIGAGLAHYDGVRWTRVVPVSDHPDFAVSDLVTTSNGEVWASLVLFGPRPNDPDPVVVVRFDGTSWHVSREVGAYSSSAADLDVTADGHVAVATEAGFLVFRGGAWDLVQEGPFSHVSVARDGTVWLGGDGLFRLTDR